VRYFFYGTLMDRVLLAHVLQRPVGSRELKPAKVRGWRLNAVRCESYPIVFRQRRALLSGVVLERSTGAERGRLSAYEGDGYTLVRAVAKMRDGGRKPVWLFAPKPRVYQPANRPWSLAAWRLGEKRLQRRRGERHDPTRT
jgi:hypothetical protein